MNNDFDEDELIKESGLIILDDDYLDVEFDQGEVQPCFGVRFAAEEVQITIDNKLIAKASLDDLKDEVDPKKPETVFSMIDTLKKEGIKSFSKKFIEVED